MPTLTYLQALAVGVFDPRGVRSIGLARDMEYGPRHEVFTFTTLADPNLVDVVSLYVHPRVWIENTSSGEV
jgi:hypothetical protein